MCCACGGGSSDGAAPPTSAPPSGTCQDTDNGATDSAGDPCLDYVNFPSWCNGYDDNDFVSSQMCCACGGGSTSGAAPPSASPANGSPTAVCTDTDNGASDPYGDGCDAYNYYPSWCGGFDSDSFQSESMCCICGGGSSGNGYQTTTARKGSAANAKTKHSGSSASKKEKWASKAKATKAAATKATSKVAGHGLTAKGAVKAMTGEAKAAAKVFPKEIQKHERAKLALLKAKHSPSNTFKLSERLRQIKAPQSKGTPTKEQLKLIKELTHAQILKDAHYQKATRAKRLRSLRRLSEKKNTLVPERV